MFKHALHSKGLKGFSVAGVILLSFLLVVPAMSQETQYEVQVIGQNVGVSKPIIKVILTQSEEPEELKEPDVAKAAERMPQALPAKALPSETQPSPVSPPEQLQTTENKKNLFFVVGRGYADLKGEDGGYWSSGFPFLGTGFYRFTPNVLIGGRFSYEWYSLDKESVRDEFKGSIDLPISGSISGYGRYIEVGPVLRVISSGDGINFFGEVGMGLCFVGSEVKMDLPVHQSSPIDFDVFRKETRRSLSLGGGVLIGDKNKYDVRFEIRPMYHILFAKGTYSRQGYVCHTLQRFSINVGVIFGG